VHVRDWLSSLETVGIKLGLAQISALLNALDHPQRAFRSLTIAGTNGKGSVAAMVERGLRAAGERTGRYTSPHLIAVEERVAIDGHAITAARFDDCANRVRLAAQALPAPPSYFEATTALALLAFRDAGVTTAVLEVGLGGRLDATNVVDAPIAVITAIALDHQEYLGDTLEAIATEKAGIIKPGARVIVGRNTDAVVGTVRGVAAAASAAVTAAPDGVAVNAEVDARGAWLTLRTPTRDYGRVRLGLAGRHQIDNAVTAVCTLETCAAAGWIDDSPESVRTALADVEWPARLEWCRDHTTDVLIDGAHNPAGAAAVTSFLQEMVPGPVPIVIGVMRDKHAAGIVEALAPVASVFVATSATSPRALPADQLAALCGAVADVRVLTCANPRSALDAASGLGAPVVVAGSLYLAGEARAGLRSA
jgi:dihydrofolate synthase/folylpolyglutamate synthase